jgi:[ribosomal protein S18]-alanine N-acetyltransferase
VRAANPTRGGLPSTRPPCFLGAASLDDLAALVRMERACFTHPWTPAQIEEALHSPARGRVLVLRSPEAPEPGRLVAYCVHRVVLDEIDICTLAVAEQWRRCGLGRWLLGRVIELSERHGVRSAFLEVRQSNWAALELYRSLGFEIVSVRRGYYQQPEEDAFVLRRASRRTPDERSNDS